MLTEQQMQANTDAEYHLKRLIAFAQCSQLSATDQQVKECLLSIFDNNVTEITICYSQGLSNRDIVTCPNGKQMFVKLVNKRSWIGGYRTELTID